MKLYLDVLISFAGELAVETKILGLFNNIAEVKHLRHCLMDNVFITTLSVLLQSTNIEVILV
jgi:Zyg-11 family protein